MKNEENAGWRRPEPGDEIELFNDGVLTFKNGEVREYTFLPWFDSQLAALLVMAAEWKRFEDFSPACVFDHAERSFWLGEDEGKELIIVKDVGPKI